jgi:flagellar basal body-associated protein FliL
MISGASNGMGYDVFISHSNKDKAAADATCAYLERNGIRCWIAPRDISPGAKWGGALVKAIRGTRVMVLIFSSHTNASEQIMREVECAVKAHATVIPVRIENVVPKDDYDYFLSVAHWLDAYNPPFESHLERLAEAIRATLLIPREDEEIPIDPLDHTGPLPHSIVEPPPSIPHPPRPPAPPPPPPVAPQYQPPPEKKSLLVPIMVIVFLLGAGGALGWYFGVAKPAADQKVLQAQAQAAEAEAELQRKSADEQAAAAAQAKADAARQAADQAAQAKAQTEQIAADQANARAAAAEQVAADAKAAADKAAAAAAAAQAEITANAATPAPAPPTPPAPVSPPPPDQGTPARDTHNLSDFVKKWCNDNASNDASVWAGDFAPRVDYCYYDGSGLAPQSFVLEDRQKLIDKWSRRSYHFNTLSASMVSDDQAHSSINFNYAYASLSGRQASGRCEVELDLAWNGYNWLISSYHETVHRQ